MCRHTAATLVAADFDGEPAAVFQCDLCGLTLPARETPDGAMPRTPLDDRALAFAVRRAVVQTNRWFAELEALKRKDRAAYRAEVRRVLGLETAGLDAGSEGA